MVCLDIVFLVLGIYGSSWIYAFIIFIIVGKLCSLFTKYIFLSLIFPFSGTPIPYVLNSIRIFPGPTVLPFFFFSFCDPFLVVSLYISKFINIFHYILKITNCNFHLKNFFGSVFIFTLKVLNILNTVVITVLISLSVLTSVVSSLLDLINCYFSLWVVFSCFLSVW